MWPSCFQAKILSLLPAINHQNMPYLSLESDKDAKLKVEQGVSTSEHG